MVYKFHYQLHIIHYPLPITHYPLPIIPVFRYSDEDFDDFLAVSVDCTKVFLADIPAFV